MLHCCTHPHVDVLASEIKPYVVITTTFKNKTLGRAQDPRANGAWLSKLTE